MLIRKIEPEDMPNVIALMREFAEFERLLERFEITERQLHSVLFDDGAYVRCLVAETDSTVCGYSLFYPCFASFRGQKGIYIEDIYISTQFRGRGIGNAMLREIARTAAVQGFQRIDFQVLDWNTGAIDFYLALGAQRDDSERHFKFTDAAFGELAK
jgi:ribosomal protein S18 acetylase RimI-like enzyme